MNFITTDITIDSERVPQERQNGFCGFQLTEKIEDFLHWVQDEDRAGDEAKEKAKTLLADYPNNYDDIRTFIEEESTLHDTWRDNADEPDEVPMMNALRYFPDYVHFEVADCYKVVGSTTLLYDTEREAWAVGMTGGGMDLSPDLLATFVSLEKGIPIDLATGAQANWSAYIPKASHLENCMIAGKALEEYGKDIMTRGQNLQIDAVGAEKIAQEKKVKEQEGKTDEK